MAPDVYVTRKLDARQVMARLDWCQTGRCLSGARGADRVRREVEREGEEVGGGQVGLEGRGVR